METTKNGGKLQRLLHASNLSPIKKRIIAVTIVAVILFAIIIAIWVGGYNAAKEKYNAKIAELDNRIEEMISTPVVLEPITPEIVQRVLAEETKDVSELVTAEYLFTNAARFTNSKHIKDWKIPGTEKSFVQKWNGTIKAGIELHEVTISVNDNVVTVTLPKAKILSYEIDYDSVEVLDEKSNVFNPITVEDKSNFDKETAKEMKERAKKGGLLDNAQENAQNIISSFLAKNLSSYQYILEFKTAK